MIRTTKLIGRKREADKEAWMGAALGRDGFVYSMPATAHHILKIDPEDGTSSLVGEDLGEGDKWIDTIVGPYGFIYGLPYDSPRIIIYDPETQTTIFCASNYLKSQMFLSFVSGQTGKDEAIYFIPSHSNKILRVDPLAGTSSVVGDDLGYSVYKYCGGAFGFDGCLYLVPFNASYVVKYNPATQRITPVGKEKFEGDMKWSSCIVCPKDRCIYCIPCQHARMLRINVEKQTVEFYGEDFGETESCKFSGGVLGQDENTLYLIPHDAEKVVMFNIEKGTTKTVGSYLGDYHCKFGGGALANDGHIYVPPISASHVLKINALSYWFYMKYRLLAHHSRAVLRNVDDDLRIVQTYLTDTNDDIFRNILEFM